MLATLFAVSALFGNTLEITFGNGLAAKAWFDTDGSARLAKADGVTGTGTWFERDGELCVAQTEPRQREVCFPGLGDQKVGDAWTSPHRTGPIAFRLVKGR